MKINSTLLLSGAFILAAIIALVVRSQLSAPRPVVQQVQAPAPKSAILVAARDLKPGEFLDESTLSWQETDQSVSRSFYFVQGKDNERTLFGATLREPIAAGTPLSSNILVRPNEPGFIAAVLHRGMRAISIPTNAVASNSGLVASGDRVDIILSLRKDDQPEPTSSASSSSGGQPVNVPLLAAQTIVRDVRVLALNDQAEAEVRPRQDVDDGKTVASRKARAPVYRTVTVEVTPKQAEALTVAKEVGLLHLALRSSADSEPGELDEDGLDSVTRLSDSTSIFRGMGGNSGHQVKLFRGEKKEVRQFPSR